MNKVIAAAAFCAALLIGSGAVLSVAAEETADLPESSESFYDPIVLDSGSLTIGDTDDSSGDASSHWSSSVDAEGKATYVDWELLSDGTLRISGNGSMPYISDYDPAPWADSRDKIKKVVVEDGITSVSSYAFQNCTNLTEADLGADVKTLWECAFAGCTNLKTITYGDQLNSIYRDAFKDTAWLADRIEENPLVIINSVLLEAHTATGDVVIPDTVNYLMANAFEDAEGMTSVVIPEAVEVLPSRIFANCTGLKSVTFPGGLYTIDSEAFTGCTSLTKVELPSAQPKYDSRSIRTGAFSGCTNLADVTVPESWKAIESTAFSGTPWFESLQKKNPLVIINNNLIDGSACKGEVVIPEGVESIPSTAFAGNTEITSVVLPASLTDARTPNIFNGCTGLTKITIQNPLYDPVGMLTNFGGPSFSGTIAGYDSSSAQSYAAAKELQFESIGSFVGKYTDAYLQRMFPKPSHCPGATVTVTSEVDMFAVGNSIGAAEFELVNADELPFTVTFSPLIQNGLTINGNAANYGKVNLVITYTLPADIETGKYTMEFRAKKLTDLEGNDLLALADEKAQSFGEIVFASGDPVYPTGLLAPVEYNGDFRPLLDEFKKNIADGWKEYKTEPSEGVLNSEDLAPVSKLWLENTEPAWYYIVDDTYLYVGAGDGNFFDAYSCADGKLLHLCSASEETSLVNLKADVILAETAEGEKKVYPYTDPIYSSSTVPAYMNSYYSLKEGMMTPALAIHHLDEKDPAKAYEIADATAEEDTVSAFVTASVSDVQSKLYAYYSSAAPEKTYLSQLTDGSEQPAFDPTTIEGLGMINEDEVVNASDAALMLIEAATIGAGKDATFTAEQTTRADVNGDKLVNASDAAFTLQYAAHIGAGGEGTFGAYMKEHLK
ncbi:MAG: leucine-rich repeat protein [Oscillospiraceae bacterium]|nr:leucine-rich repeat protein [Oscillospiraceae bacterium]